MTPEQLIMKCRKEFFNIFEYDPPTAEIIEELKDNTLNIATHMIALTKQIESMEKELARKTAELDECRSDFNTHKEALEILRSEKK
ncbi:MAG: hypothetical protein UHG68_07205 [Clostridia bacterium]|nr:hypothetical protein [Clostridia bacterium]